MPSVCLTFSYLFGTDPLGIIRTNVTVRIRCDVKHAAFLSLIRWKRGLDAGVSREKRKVWNSKLWWTIIGIRVAYLLHSSIMTHTHNWICVGVSLSVIPDIALTWITLHSARLITIYEIQRLREHGITKHWYQTCKCLSCNIKLLIAKSDLMKHKKFIGQ
jgi:hypothetical protein